MCVCVGGGGGGGGCKYIMWCHNIMSTMFADPADVMYLEFLTLGSTGVITQMVPSFDDGTSNPIIITNPFPFGNSHQTVVYVSSHCL